MRISIQFMKKVYHLLVHGNSDIHFYCTCLYVEDRENLVQQPYRFALKILAINFLFRFPHYKEKYLDFTLGKDYLSDKIKRHTVHYVANQLLESSRLITDLFGSAVILLKPPKDIFTLTEKTLGIQGFAALREKADNEYLSLREIYDKINASLSTNISVQTELQIMRRYCIPNPYLVRLFDIANYNNISVTAAVSTSYPRKFINQMLADFNIQIDQLLLTHESKQDRSMTLKQNAADSLSLISADYDLIYYSTKLDCIRLYYRDPLQMFASTRMPALSDDFAAVYKGIAGLQIFNSEKRRSRAYEYSYLMLAPAIYGFMQTAKAALAHDELLICSADSRSFFCHMYAALYDTDIALSQEGSDLGARIENTVGQYRKILLLEPFPSEFSLSDVGDALKKIKPSAEYRCMRMCDYLHLSPQELRPLSTIMDGRNFLLNPDHEPEDVNRAAGAENNREITLEQSLSAIEDFCLSFHGYCINYHPGFTVSGQDAASLYTFAPEQMNEMGLTI